jgi:hypothetical protein
MQAKHHIYQTVVHALQHSTQVPTPACGRVVVIVMFKPTACFSEVGRAFLLNRWAFNMEAVTTYRGLSIPD